MNDKPEGTSKEKDDKRELDLANNPFALLLQPPSPSLATPGHSQSHSNTTQTDSRSKVPDVCTYLERLQNQGVSKDGFISISQEAKVSNQRTLYDIAGYPVAAPISALESVLSWEPGHDDICVSSVPLKQRVPSPFDEPNVLVCHDMMGGYTNDRFIQGHPTVNDYNIYHWQHISSFVYFSHNLVTIPPPCWTNAAHQNGVLSLGTVITEWQDGARLCARLFSSEDNVSVFVQNLIRIAEYYRFDGWLVNIENPIHPSHMANLYVMLTLLTTGMHEAIPGSKVIWYDSVTSDGELKWQSCLNEKNESFFGVCDSIFLDYHWSLDRLHRSRSFAGGRAVDVYVGVDVFGRDRFYGGGGFNCNVALKAINEAGLSTALFATGWVYENLDKDQFFENQDRFWALLTPHCPVYPITTLPLVCSFNRGCGNKVVIDGQVAYESPWANLSSQDLQPSFPDQYFKNTSESAIQLHAVKIDSEYAYNNGSSLVIKGRLTSPAGKPANVRLFKTDHLSLAEPLLVSYTYHTDSSNRCGHMIRLRTDGTQKFILLDPSTISDSTNDTTHGLPHSQQVALPPDLNLDATSHIIMAALPPKYTAPLHNVFTGNDENTETFWKTSYFLVHSPAHQKNLVRGLSISLYPTGGEGLGSNVSLIIGELKIMNPSSVSPTSLPSTIGNLDYEDAVCNSSTGKLSVTLRWEAYNSPIDPVEHVNVYSTVEMVEKDSSGWESDAIFIGRAHGTRFRVIKMDLPVSGDGTVIVKFQLQPVTVTRQKPPIKSSPLLKLSLIP